MTIWLPVSLASLLVLQPGASSSDSRPTFSGTWRMDAARSASAASNDSVEPLLLEITQTDRELTIVTTQGERHNKIVHTFVANPTTPFSVDGSAGRAYWEGVALVTEGTRLVQGQTVATRETRRLNADRSEMIVDLVVIVQHGYEFRGARNYGTGRDVYTRVAR